jgi:integrase
MGSCTVTSLVPSDWGGWLRGAVMPNRHMLTVRILGSQVLTETKGPPILLLDTDRWGPIAFDMAPDVIDMLRRDLKTAMRSSLEKNMEKLQNRVERGPLFRRNRPRNSDLRTREYLTESEIERLMAVAKRNRWGHRDATMILVTYRHGLRASELVDLRWDQLDFNSATLHVRRVMNGTPASHPIGGDELRALRRLQREQEPRSPFVFVSERGARFTPAGFARVIERAGVEAELGFPAHPHMLRHACGYKLANDGVDTRALQAYLGHRNIVSTTRYSELAHKVPQPSMS